jgi:hypothetical protein
MKTENPVKCVHVWKEAGEGKIVCMKCREKSYPGRRTPVSPGQAKEETTK